MKSVNLAALVCCVMIALSGCVAVAPTTAAKLAHLSPLEADPAEIRVALLVPDRMKMRPDSAKLAMFYTGKDGDRRREDYTLEILAGNATSPHLIGELGSERTIYTVRLSNPDAARMRAFQKWVAGQKAAGKDGRGGISISFNTACWLSSYPATGPVRPLSAYIQTERGGEFLLIYKNVSLARILKRANQPDIRECDQE